MAKKSDKTDKIKVKLSKSLIGCTEKQIKVAKGLGLNKTNQVVEHFSTPTIMGMVKRIPHLLEVVE
jgi:large subunit ribosomal protein L30